MDSKQDIDEILNQWPFDPQSVNVRMLEFSHRQVLQMRVDMGVLQLETEGRPDGNVFQGATTYFDYLKRQSEKSNQNFELDEDCCLEIDREFVQFYHRRVCWLQLKEFELAVRDADHTLGLMDFCKEHSPDEQWTISHEQYRPFVIYHRTQAAALAQINDDSDAEEEDPNAVERAIEEVNQGIENLRILFVEYEAEDQFEYDELVQRLSEFREGLREKYNVGKTLKEQLEEAIANENYERAALVRDAISKRI